MVCHFFWDLWQYYCLHKFLYIYYLLIIKTFLFLKIFKKLLIKRTRSFFILSIFRSWIISVSDFLTIMVIVILCFPHIFTILVKLILFLIHYGYIWLYYYIYILLIYIVFLSLYTYFLTPETPRYFGVKGVRGFHKVFLNLYIWYISRKWTIFFST